MEDELLLADLAVVEKRLERLAKDLKKARTAELEREQALLLRCKAELDNGVPLRTMQLEGRGSAAAARASSSCRRSRCCWC